MTIDPYASHVRQAETFFSNGEPVKAGQIWQAILKQQPTHAKAREGLLAVKQLLRAQLAAEVARPGTPPLPEPEPALAPPPVPAHYIVPTPEEPRPPRMNGEFPDPDRLVTEGCTLYDMGLTEEALRKWEEALAMDASHLRARSYANGARRELGLSVMVAATLAAPLPVEAYPAGDDTDKLLREAVQLYEMGLVEEAIPKWERVLVLEPNRHEVKGYLTMARNEIGQGKLRTPVAMAPGQAALEPEALGLKLRQAEHLLNLQRHEEAAFTFQQVLLLSPGDARALEGLERCRKPSAPTKKPLDALPSFPPVMPPDLQGRIAMVDQESRSSTPVESQGIQPPATLLKGAPAPRVGLSVPDRVRAATSRLPWLGAPKVLAFLGGTLLTLLVSCVLLQNYRREQALKENVRAAREAAVAPLNQQSQVPGLAESPEAIRKEAETTLVTDPLRAFLRAETLVNLNPKDAAAPQLLEKARAALPGGATGATQAEFQKHLQNGDLEAAQKVINALLRATPASSDLRARMARLQLSLCTAHASQAKWNEAREDLLRGRALFPGDKTWQMRLKFLEQVKALPKNQQGLWIPLLG